MSPSHEIFFYFDFLYLLAESVHSELIRFAYFDTSPVLIFVINQIIYAKIGNYNYKFNVCFGMIRMWSSGWSKSTSQWTILTSSLEDSGRQPPTCKIKCNFFCEKKPGFNYFKFFLWAVLTSSGIKLIGLWSVRIFLRPDNKCQQNHKHFKLYSTLCAWSVWFKW
jgi:hypothetical protein